MDDLSRSEVEEMIKKHLAECAAGNPPGSPAHMEGLLSYRVTLLEARMLTAEMKMQKAIYLLFGNLVGIIVILIEQFLRLTGKL